MTEPNPVPLSDRRDTAVSVRGRLRSAARRHRQERRDVQRSEGHEVVVLSMAGQHFLLLPRLPLDRSYRPTSDLGARKFTDTVSGPVAAQGRQEGLAEASRRV